MALKKAHRAAAIKQQLAVHDKPATLEIDIRGCV